MHHRSSSNGFGKILLTFFLLFFFFIPLSQANQQLPFSPSGGYVIPKLCVERAKSMNFFKNIKKEDTEKALRQTYKGSREVNFYAIDHSYQETLENVKEEMENDQSELFKYLKKCLLNKRFCTGYFSAKNAFHQRLYCDAAIYVALSNNDFNSKFENYKKNILTQENTDAKKATMESFYESLSETRDSMYFTPLFEEHMNASLVPEGFLFIFQKVIEEFENADDYKSNQKKLDQYYNTLKFQDQLNQCCYGSYLPQYQKSKDEFSAMLQIKFNISLINFLVFEPRDPITINLFDQSIADDWRAELQNKKISQLSADDQLKFFSFLSHHPLFYKNLTEGFQKSRQIIRHQPESTWPTTFLTDDKQVQEYKQKNGYQPFKSQYDFISKYGEPPTGWPRDLRVGSVYGKNQLFSIASFSRADQVSPFILNMLFNDQFATDYTQELKSQIFVEESQKYKNSLQDNYGYFLNGFKKYAYAQAVAVKLRREIPKLKIDFEPAKLDYVNDYFRAKAQDPNQFIPAVDLQGRMIPNILLKKYSNYIPGAKLAQAKKYYDQAIQFLQNGNFSAAKINIQKARKLDPKNELLLEMLQDTQTNLKNISLSEIYFVSWAEDSICDPGHVPSKALLPDYCSSQFRDFRLTQFSEMFSDLLSKRVVMLSAAGSTEYRKYIYGNDLKPINTRIQDINDYCWNQVDPSGYEKNPEKYENDPIINKKLEAFLTYPTVHELMAQQEFSDVFSFDASQLRKLCFTQGHIFGPLHYTKFAETYSQINNHLGNPFKYFPWKTVYLPPSFQIQDKDLQFLEDRIERRISDEFSKLRMISSMGTRFDSREQFLLESINERVVPIIEYAIESPSKNVGRMICYLLRKANNNESARIERKKAEFDIFMTGFTVATVLIGPEMIGGRMLMYEWGTLFVFTAAATGESIDEIVHIDRKKEALSRTGTLKNTRVDINTLYLQSMYRGELNEARTKLAISLGLTLALSTRPIISLVKFIQYCRSDYGAVYAYRAVEFEKFLRSSPWKPSDFDQKFLDFIYNKDNPLFNDFMKELNAGNGKTFVESTWKNQLEKKKIPIPKFEPVVKELNGWQKFWSYVGTKMKLSWKKVLLNTFSKIKRIRYFAGDRLFQESKIADMLNAGLDKKFFTEKDIEGYKEILKNNFRWDASAEVPRFIKIFDETLSPKMEVFFIKVIPKNIAPELREVIVEELKKQIRSEFLTSEEWIFFFDHFNMPITSLDDCKIVLKEIKFMELEYHGIKVFQNWWELLDLRDLFRTYIYPNRAREISENADDYFKRGKYYSIKNDLNLIKEINMYMDDTGQTLDEVEAAIQAARKKIDPKDNFTLKGKLNGKFDKDEIEKMETSKKKLEVDFSHYTIKYHKEYMEQEENIGTSFVNFLKQEMEKERKMGNKFPMMNAYENAYRRIQIKKTLRNECQLPESTIREDVNRHYRNTAMLMAFGSTVGSYYLQHPAPTTNQQGEVNEWIRRYGAEVGLSTLTSLVQSRVAISKNRSWYYKSFRYEFTTMMSIFGDSNIYEAGNGNLWNTDDKYEAEFAHIIYSSENVQETLKKYFDKYSDLKNEILHRYTALEELFDDLEKKGELGLMPADEIENEFVKKGLIESIFQNTDKNDRLSDQKLYNHLVEKGFISADLFKGSEDISDDIINLMTEIVYQDKRYKDQGGYDSNRSTAGLSKEAIENKSDPLFGSFLTSILPDSFLENYHDDLYFSSEVDDRLIFNLKYEGVHFPAALIKNYLVYQTLCKGRYLPYPANIILARASYAMYRIPIDIIKFDWRKSETGN